MTDDEILAAHVSGVREAAQAMGRSPDEAEQNARAEWDASAWAVEPAVSREGRLR